LIKACQGLAENEESLHQREMRVYSLPCWELLDEQPAAYKAEVLGPAHARRVSLEAGVTLGWSRFTGLDGLTIGVDTFGYSAPGPDLARHFGLEPQQVQDRIAAWLNSPS
jgi:transketolase